MRAGQPAVTDRLHLPQGHRLRLVLSVYDPGRLLALQHRLEAVHPHVAEDVTDTFKLVLEASGCDSAEVVHEPRLLSDNGSSTIAGDLANWLEAQPAWQCPRHRCFDHTPWLYAPSRYRFVPTPHKTGGRGTTCGVRGNTISAVRRPSVSVIWGTLIPSQSSALRCDVTLTRTGARASIHFSHKMQFLYLPHEGGEC